MKRCLACHERFFDAVGWRKLLLIEPEDLLCSLCESELSRIEGRTCKTCSRPLEKINNAHRKEDQCLDCWRWEEREDTATLLERNVSLYEYNPFLKEWLATYKYKGDAVIATYFSPMLHKVYQKQFQRYTPIAMPLSRERLQTRGFNQSALLLLPWAEDQPVLDRTSGEKQSKKSRKQRIDQFHHNPFTLQPNAKSKVENRNILLIDDVYTTGTTIRQAAKLLKEHGAKNVASLTIAR
ncbi:ComF family protein [Halalkalibacter alkalisediminis]|uniref:ComF family protein n=1 Tax=Halalkalibacter alkalisediminis TaxID=935616 RepID=A0ABV6NEV1_9BACI|nr:ComF family protein [Halalkalibacter alkalisediminis]